jgi:hypothetical protein
VAGGKSVGVKHEEMLLAALASHGDALHRIAHVYAAGDGEDDDLYQEILMEAWKALPSFRGTRRSVLGSTASPSTRHSHGDAGALGARTRSLASPD